MTKKLITIAIASCNNGKYIERSIDSVINQTYKELEILIVDDGSTDDTMQRIKKYQSDSRVKIISKENGGLSSVRQLSLELANGDYISFIDADDYLVSTFVEKMLGKLMSDNSDVCVCSTRFVDEEGHLDERKSRVMSCVDSVEPISTTNWFKNYKGISKKIHLSDSWNKMYSVSILRKSGVTFDMPKGLNGTDTVFNRKLVLHCPTYSTLKDELYVHVIYKLSAVHRKNKDLLSSFMLITEKLKKEADKMNYEPSQMQWLTIYYYGCLFRAYNDVYKESVNVKNDFNSLFKKHITFIDRINLVPLKKGQIDSLTRKVFAYILIYCHYLLPIYIRVYNKLGHA